jgi:hypothetical protein
MPFTFGSIAAMSDDSGSDTDDFITSDRTVSFSGFAAGNGTLGFWLDSPDFPSPIFIGDITIGASDPHIWTFSDLSSIPLPDGDYTIIITNGTGAASLSSPLDSQDFAIDNTAPEVTIDAVEGDDVLTAPESTDGLQVSGTAAGADGQTIEIEVRDAFDNVLFTETAIVTGGTWSTTFHSTVAGTLTGVDYSIHASVTDAAGNTGDADHDFTSTVCFMAGTMIATPRGEVPVESIKRGDLVTTADGRTVPVAWLGIQTVSRRFSDPLRVWPIRVKAGALDENVPSRDLLISPDHAILVDGALVQAGALVNGTSITREERLPAKFTYYHVEADDHSLILAHNVPAETFVDNVDRLGFDNWREHQALYPEGKPVREMPYPRVLSARQVPRATAVRLMRRSAAFVAPQEAVAA